MIVRYLNIDDAELYASLGWRVTYYGVRSCVGHVFIASFQCVSRE